MENYNKLDEELNHRPTKFDQREDPLEANRANKEGIPMGDSYYIGDEILGNEDAVELDSQLVHELDYEWKEGGKLAEGEDIYQRIAESYPDGLSDEDLQDEFAEDNVGRNSYKYDDRKDFFEKNASSDIKDSFDIPFEEREILIESLAETKDARQKNKLLQENENKNRLEVTKEEFALMEECSKFNSLVRSTETMEKLIEDRPKFVDGKPLTDDQVLEQAERWRDCKENRLHNKYTESDISLMKHCGQWMFWYRKFTTNRKNPVFTNSNEPLSKEQIDEQAQEYSQIRNENPKLFAELKYQNFEWYKKSFNWQEEDFKGKKQWRCWMKRKTKDGKGEQDRKYISEKEPVSASGEFYYTTKNKFNVKTKNGAEASIVYVDIKYPRDNSATAKQGQLVKEEQSI